MQTVLTENLQAVKRILQAHKVKQAYVFGSVCTDKFNAESDIDFLVTFEKIPLGQYSETIWSLEDELKALFNREIDIVIDKEFRNPYFVTAMNRTKTLIYERRTQEVLV